MKSVNRGLRCAGDTCNDDYFEIKYKPSEPWKQSLSVTLNCLENENKFSFIDSNDYFYS